MRLWDDKNIGLHRPTIRVTIQCGARITSVLLPLTSVELNRALTRIGARDNEYSIMKCQLALELPLDELVIGCKISVINYLAARLSILPPFQLDKLEAIMQSEMRFNTIEQLIDFTYNTDYFILTPNIHNAEELARYYIYESGMIEMPDEWKSGIDLLPFGTNLEKCEKGSYTDKGYLLLSGDPWKPIFEESGVVPLKFTS